MRAVTDLWCKLFHPHPMWPIHGYYRCPRCFRQYPVPWEHPNVRTRQVPHEPDLDLDHVPSQPGAFFDSRIGR